MPIVAFLIGFGVTFFILSFFIKPLFKLLTYFFLYVVLPVAFGILLFAYFFTIKAKTKNSWLDFGLLLLIISAHITSFTNWGIYFLAYSFILITLGALMLAYVGSKMLFDSYKRYKNSSYYAVKKIQKAQMAFEKNYKKTSILLENMKNKELKAAADENDATKIESRANSLKNAFEFLANKHQIIINKKDIKAINEITKYFALPNGDELIKYEQAYRAILARHKK